MYGHDIAVFLRVLYKWLWLIALVLATVCITMFVIAMRAEPMYRATVTIQITAPPPQEVPLFSTVDREAISQQIERTRDNVAQYLQVGDVVHRLLERLPEINMTEAELSKQIDVTLPTNSQLMDVSVSASTPETAAQLANMVAEVGQEYYAELLAEPTELARKFIEEQLEIAETDLNDAEMELEQFRVDSKVYDLDKTIDIQNGLLRELRSESDLALVEGREDVYAKLQTVVSFREEELQNLIRLVPRYNQLAVRVKQASESAAFLVEKRNEALIKENQILAMSTIRVISPARPPRNPVPVFGNAIILLSIVTSLAAGIMLALLLEFLEVSGLFGRSRMPADEGNVSSVR
ncbi:MAG: hypothetical protein IT328_07215 [Caldilineaceae bacterium]|nr:hypothetical protein [Caldilineaceae bacterium]